MNAAIFHNHPIHYKHLLFKEMFNLGLDFTVLFGGTQSNIRNELIPLSQDLYKYRFLFDGPLESAPVFPRMAAALRALRELKPQVIISCGYERPENWVGWFWALFNRIPVILWYESNHFDWPRSWWKELPKRLFMKGLVGAHVYGWTNREYLITLGLPANNILIKRAVVDVARFDLPAAEKQYRTGQQVRLLYIGRLAPEKNLAFLLNSLAAARAVGGDLLHLTLIGTGPAETTLRQQANTLNLSVSFKGYVPQVALPPHVRDADFFILPSTREPWGLVALEAMLARMPVLLSTRCGCSADLITPNTGWSFSPFDPAELTQLLAALPAISVARVKEMGEAAHQIAINYSPQNSAEAVVRSIYDLPRHSNRVRGPLANIAPRL